MGPLNLLMPNSLQVLMITNLKLMFKHAQILSHAHLPPKSTIQFEFSMLMSKARQFTKNLDCWPLRYRLKSLKNLDFFTFKTLKPANIFF